VTPGLNDAHQHIEHGARELANLDLSSETTLGGIERSIGEFARASPAREWINGHGWFYAVFPGGFPDRSLLDRLVPDRPAAFSCFDMHSYWVNSMALERMGISREMPDPPGGQIVRDDRGDATGILKETAMELVRRALPPLSEATELDLFEQAMRLAAATGLTSLQDACIPPGRFEIFSKLREARRPVLRVRLAQMMEPGLTLAEWERRLTDYEGDAFPRRADPYLRGGILKTFMDGVVESRTASMLAPYEGSVAGDPGVLGQPRWEPGEFKAALLVADRRGWQVQAHAIGDRGIRDALDAFEAAPQVNGPRDRRHRIEHIEAIDPDDVPRFGGLGVVASMQPLHADPSTNLFEAWAKQIGPLRASHGWPWASIARAGGCLAFGSDWPVMSFDPRLGLNSAVNRSTANGEPRGGWIPQEKLGVADALAAYTRGSAFAEFAENVKGALRRGMLADITIFDRDLLTAPSEEILEASVQATIVGGDVRYENRRAAALNR